MLNKKRVNKQSDSPIVKLLSKYEQLNDSRLPTPCHKLELNYLDARTDLYVKRDDLTGIALGGNKTRKLDFVFPKLIKDGVDAIVAIGVLSLIFVGYYVHMARAMGSPLI